MFNIALKIGEAALGSGGPLADIFTKGIMTVTGSPYSHAEFWFSGPINQALCFSARELNDGVGWKTIDLSNKAMWKILPLQPTVAPDTLEMRDRVWWFLQGNVGRDYDTQGILGILNNTDHHDKSDRFCSEMVFDLGQQCFGWRKDIPAYHVAPGWTKEPVPPQNCGPGHRAGLYELYTAGALLPISSPR